MKAICKGILVGIALLVAHPGTAAVAEERAQLARIHEQNQEFNLAVEEYETAVDEIELADGPYSPRLIEPLTGLGRSYLALGEYELADQTLKRAQHLAHRDEGVHSLTQLPVIDVLTEKYLREDKPLKADQQQRFALYVAEHQYGKNSTDIVPALYKHADWYMESGQYRQARETLERITEIIKSEGGDTDLRLLKPLMLIAKARRLEGICCSYKGLEPALEVLEHNPEATDDMLVDAWLALGDAYLASHDEEQAHQYYKSAWALDPDRFDKPHKIAMSDSLESSHTGLTRYYRVEQDVFGRRRLEEMTPEEKQTLENQPPQEFLLPLSEENYNIKITDRRHKMEDVDPVIKLVGEPFKFNYEQLRYILPLNKRAPDELAGLYVTASFTVDAEGNVENIEIVDSNSPVRLNRLVQKTLRKTQFRPAFVDGNPVKTEEVKLTQTFQ